MDYQFTNRRETEMEKTRRGYSGGTIGGGGSALKRLKRGSWLLLQLSPYQQGQREKKNKTVTSGQGNGDCMGLGARFSPFTGSPLPTS